MTGPSHSPRRPLCRCGSDHAGGPTCEAALDDHVDQALLAALFPEPINRRRLLGAVGAATLLAALSDILPVGSLKALAQTPGPLEKPEVAVGFLPITCATPLIMAQERGLFARQRLTVSLQKVAGIALIRDKMLSGELDLSQQVMPVALATTAGAGGTGTIPTKVLTILNQNGNSLVLGMQHKDNRDPRKWKGFRFAVPFEQSHQTLQLRYYLAEHGLDPDSDVTYRVVPPSEYVSNLRVGSIDGFFGGEPGGQRAVYEGAGFIHLVSKDIWPGHPCCSTTATDSWIKAHPATFMAFFRAAVEAGLYASDAANRPGMAKVLAQPNYLNAPETVIDQVITGRFADGLGAVRTLPDRVDFQPLPHYSTAVWLLVQMRRWNMLKQDVDYKALAREVMLATDAAKLMRDAGGQAPSDPEFGIETVMGKPFDSNDPEAYLRQVRKPG